MYKGSARLLCGRYIFKSYIQLRRGATYKEGLPIKKTHKMYRSPAVSPPTFDELQSLAARHHLHIDNDEMEQIKDELKKTFARYDRLEELPEPGLQTNYPSLPGYKPRQEDNTYNAWARITNTPGASSGKLSGKTMAIKDNVGMAGVPMTIGSQLMMGYVPAYHATVVKRVLDAGVFIKGKAVCENLCYSGSSFTSVPAPVLNFYDKDRVCGGSSSGNAVLIAAGEVDLGIGTDQGGSVRLPSCWSGIVGLKPTYGLVPYTGIVPLEGTMDHAGPMAKTVKDCALLLEVIAGYDGGLDPRQPTNLVVPKYSELLDGKITGKRIALIEEGFKGCEPDVADIVKEAASTLGSLGAVVEEISFPPHVDVSVPASAVITEGTYNTYVNGGITPLNSKGYKDTLTHDFLFNAAKSKADSLPLSMKRVVLAGAFIREKYGNHFYAKAMNVLRDFVEQYDKLFEKYDVLIMPTIKYKPPKQPEAGFPLSEYFESHLNMTDNTMPYNATGHPALSINAGFSEGLPVGMMIVGRHFDEATVLNVAYAFEQKRDANEL